MAIETWLPQLKQGIAIFESIPRRILNLCGLTDKAFSEYAEESVFYAHVDLPIGLFIFWLALPDFGTDIERGRQKFWLEFRFDEYTSPELNDRALPAAITLRRTWNMEDEEDNWEIEINSEHPTCPVFERLVEAFSLKPGEVLKLKETDAMLALDKLIAFVQTLEPPVKRHGDEPE